MLVCPFFIAAMNKSYADRLTREREAEAKTYGNAAGGDDSFPEPTGDPSPQSDRLSED